MRDRAGRASQATEDREARLQQRRYRLDAETAEEREARLQLRRERLAAETPDEGEARLQYMRDRLAAETPEEREARLQHISTCQHERLAAETAEERSGYSVTDRDTEINSLCSHRSHCLNCIPFKLRCISFMHVLLR